MATLAALSLAVPAGATSSSPSSSGRGQANSVTFEDSQGEDPMGPDVTSMVVSNDDTGLITFQINIPNRPTFTGDMLLLLFLDTDDNPATGDPDLFGTDYAIQLEALGGPASVLMFRWDGTTYSSAGVLQTTLVFSYANGATIKINASELGQPKRLKFVVIALSGIVIGPDGTPDFTSARRDFAPDPGHGLYPYDVKIKPPSLVVRKFTAKPLKPVAGRPFTVVMSAARSDTGEIVQSAKVTCKATVAFKTIVLRTLKAVGAQASCTWVIPKKTTGKTLRGSIAIEFEGLTAKRTFSAKIG